MEILELKNIITKIKKLKRLNIRFAQVEESVDLKIDKDYAIR